MNTARVLVVEDEAEWQGIVTELMADEEYFCYTADSYEKALEKLRQGSFNIVFLDLMLHEFDRSVREGSGWRLLNYLVEQHPRTRVVILSGRATAGDAVRIMRDYTIAAFIDKSEPDVETQIVKAVQQAMQAPSLRIQSLGRFTIWRNGQLVDAWDSAQSKTLVKLLLSRRAARERTVSADKLVEWLWPGRDPQDGRKDLLPLINSARLALEPTIEPRDSNFILRNADGYYFEVDTNTAWDVARFQELCHEASMKQRTDTSGAIAALEAARALYTDDFLTEDGPAAWAIPPRQALQSEYRACLGSLAEAYSVSGQLPAAIRTAEALLKADPLMESVYRQLMVLYTQTGNKPQALKIYRNCEKLFGEVYGEGVSPQTKRLFDLISSDAKLDPWMTTPAAVNSVAGEPPG